MKTIISIALWAFTALSCSHTLESQGGNPNKNTITLHEGKGYTNYKNEFFINCLKKLYPEKFSLMLDSLDASQSANIDQLNYDTQLQQLVDSLAESFTKRNEANWSIENRKVTLNVCISYRNSKELVQIAVSFFRRQNKNKTSIDQNL
jgi:hypothetical protein